MSSACMQASATTSLLTSPTSLSPDTDIQIHQTEDICLKGKGKGNGRNFK